MPELELRDALHDLADEVAIVDLLPRVDRHLRARRRTVLVSAAIGTMVTAVSAVALSTLGDVGRRGPSQPIATVSPAPTASETNAAGVTVSADYLPDGAKALPPHDAPGGRGTFFFWSLPGKPFGSVDVYVTKAPPDKLIPPRQDQWTRVTPVDINGHPGYLTEDRDGYGGVNVEWAMDGYMLQARTLRAYPHSDRSAGVSDDVLLQFARGLRLTTQQGQ